MNKIFTILMIIFNLSSFAQFGKDHYVDFINPGYLTETRTFGWNEPINGTLSHAIADFDGNGYKDVIFLGSGQNNLYIIKNINGTSFSSPKLIYNPNSSDSRYYGFIDLVPADFNNDGKMDFVASLSYSESSTSGGYKHIISW
ncbi:MAG TPA: VCBS repeat-containing protein [Chitinophagales bacterium]|nr:VCBS repeat-containing protein [Chitinophagales bacterium]